MIDDREELRLRVRDERPPLDASVVVRGGPDTASLLRSHARRLNRLYVLDGDSVRISVFVAYGDIGATSERTILRANSTAIRPSTAPRWKLLRRGLNLLPTFAAPHYTVVIPDLDAVAELAAAFGNLFTTRTLERRGGRHDNHRYSGRSEQ